ncbi:Zinc finger, U1-type [Corchorus olitorius]|uniref:Zinc finger, U1-type n=1 Tax=Corchorus olitorius TaxID=93759 RepID=A0A1R3GNV4_9ROSI|nr:Zinc finger, U1-type [Corchorus olitorius]
MATLSGLFLREVGFWGRFLGFNDICKKKLGVRSVKVKIMPRYYCDYCDTYLTHDSLSVRKQHNAGYKHKDKVRIYYQQFEAQQTQSLIDQRIMEHLGQAAAFNQHLNLMPQTQIQRPRLPVFPTPIMPNIQWAAPLPVNQPMVPGMRV